MTKQKLNVIKFEMRHNGVFDLDKLYKVMRKWYKDRKYLFQESVHKFKPPELELDWSGTRKETGYRQALIEMKFHSWYHKEVKVKEGEKEKNMVDARVQIILSATMVYDYAERFNTPFLAFLEKFLKKFVLFYYIIIVWPDRLHYELVDFQNKIKESLESTTEKGAY